MKDLKLSYELSSCRVEVVIRYDESVFGKPKTLPDAADIVDDAQGGRSTIIQFEQGAVVGFENGTPSLLNTQIFLVGEFSVSTTITPFK